MSNATYAVSRMDQGCELCCISEMKLLCANWQFVQVFWMYSIWVARKKVTAQAIGHKVNEKQFNIPVNNTGRLDSFGWR